MQGVAAWPFALRRGDSDNPAEGTDALSVISWVVYGKHGYAPKCVSQVIGAYVARGNGYLQDGDGDSVRQRFLPFLHRIAGSRSKEHEEARLRILRLAAVRIFLPRALDAAGRPHLAASLRALPDDVDMSTAATNAWRASEALMARFASERAAGVVAAKNAALAGRVPKMMDAAASAAWEAAQDAQALAYAVAFAAADLADESAVSAAREAKYAEWAAVEAANAALAVRAVAWARALAARVVAWARGGVATANADAVDSDSGAVAIDAETVAAEAATQSAHLAGRTGAWDDYFEVLDDVLNAGPQGGPWSAEMVNRGVTAFVSAGGMALAA